jgi:hypothetical protein
MTMKPTNGEVSARYMENALRAAGIDPQNYERAAAALGVTVHVYGRWARGRGSDARTGEITRGVWDACERLRALTPAESGH